MNAGPTQMRMRILLAKRASLAPPVNDAIHPRDEDAQELRFCREQKGRARDLRDNRLPASLRCIPHMHIANAG